MRTVDELIEGKERVIKTRLEHIEKWKKEIAEKQDFIKQYRKIIQKEKQQIARIRQGSSPLPPATRKD
jgi:DNA-binding protein H-NS